MNEFRFYLPVKVDFSCGRINDISGILEADQKRILIVSDRGVEKCGAVERVKEALKGCEVSVFTGISENPAFEEVDQGAKQAREFSAGLVLGLGGGSPMDAAKGIAVLANHSFTAREMLAGASIRSPLPIVCIPTTSGTGSEVTPYVVFTDRENGNKCGFGHETLYPRLALLDPEMTFSMPASLVINTGLDALTHALEAYLCLASTPFTDLLAEKAMEGVVENLEAAAGHNRDAMVNMAYSSMLAGITIANSGTILLHIQAYPLTVYHSLPHGRANAVLLPRFLAFLRRKSKSAQGKIDRIEMILEKRGGVDRFLDRLGVSTDLRDYGVSSDEIPLFIEKTIVKSDVPLTPAPVSEEDIAEIYGL